jgi:hypothetical protein
LLTIEKFPYIEGATTPSILPQTEEIPQAKAFGMTIILGGQQPAPSILPPK